MPNDQDKPDRAPGAPSPDSPSAAIAQPGDAVMKAKAQDDATIAEQQAALAAERKALAAERARLDARLDEADARHRLASADQALEGHVKAGRILPAERPRLAALMAHLASGSKDADRTAGADGEATTLCFAGPDGTETQEQPEAALEAFLSALPVRVHYGVVAGSDTTPAAAQAGDPTVVEKAHALMAADATGTLTIDRAVRRVRAEMGEPNHA